MKLCCAALLRIRTSTAPISQTASKTVMTDTAISMPGMKPPSAVTGATGVKSSVFDIGAIAPLCASLEAKAWVAVDAVTVAASVSGRLGARPRRLIQDMPVGSGGITRRARGNSQSA